MTSTKQHLHQNCLTIVHSLENDRTCPHADIVNDALDIEYTIAAKGNYLGARILMSFGGPNIWIDTRHNVVEGYWGHDRVELPFTDEHGIHELCEDFFSCVVTRP